jgi:hypothetical protein
MGDSVVNDTGFAGIINQNPADFKTYLSMETDLCNQRLRANID